MDSSKKNWIWFTVFIFSVIAFLQIISYFDADSSWSNSEVVKMIYQKRNFYGTK